MFCVLNPLKILAQYVIPHFDKYPLLTQKRADYLLFKQVVDLILRKEHLTSKGLLEILSIKASLNWGLPDVLKKAFPDIVPKNRPGLKGVFDPQWLAGFAEGESCFFVEKSVSKTHRSGYQVRLKFIISQDVRDVAILNSFKNYLNCGGVITDSRGMSQFIVRKKSDIIFNILPFFAKYPLVVVN